MDISSHDFFFYFNISRSTKINYGLSIGLQNGLIVVGWHMVFTLTFFLMREQKLKRYSREMQLISIRCVSL